MYRSNTYLIGVHIGLNTYLIGSRGQGYIKGPISTQQEELISGRIYPELPRGTPSLVVWHGDSQWERRSVQRYKSSHTSRDQTAILLRLLAKIFCVCFFPLQNLSASIHLSTTTITIKSNKKFVSLLIFIERNLVVFDIEHMMMMMMPVMPKLWSRKMSIS